MPRDRFFYRIFRNSIKFYQRFISPNLGSCCRFYPSCSEYFLRCVEKYGVVKGLFLGLKRVIKCNPFCAGGIDLP